MSPADNPSAHRRRVLFVIALLALASALVFAYWWRMGRAVAVVDAPSDRLSCVSYAPHYRPGQTPFAVEERISPEQIEEDLRLLSQRFGCVRTYSVSHGLDAVPAIARSFGVKVMLGIWLGRDPLANEREINLGIATANSRPETVSAVIVGNEVLLRRELPLETLRAHIERVRAAVKQRVTYADVWEFWLKNAELAQSTAFVTIHILPYWEDEPIAIEGAVAHVLDIYESVRRSFPGQAVVIGETGWPSVGRNRQGAIPSRVNQARFMREFALAAHTRDLPYNVIEAFDQPWKRLLEGAVGGYWGLYATDGRKKFEFQGPVVEEPRWKWGFAAAGIAALTFLAVGLWRRRPVTSTGGLILLLAGALTGGTLAAQARMIWLANRTLFEWWLSTSYALAVLLAGVLAAMMLCAWAANPRSPPAVASMSAVMERLVLGTRGRDASAVWLGGLRFFFLFGTAAQCLLLVFDARYRDFPLELIAVPALMYALLALAARGAQQAAPEIEERVLSWGIVILVPLVAFIERASNLHALAWCGLCLLLAAPMLSLARAGVRAHEHEHAQQEGRG